MVVEGGCIRPGWEVLIFAGILLMYVSSDLVTLHTLFLFLATLIVLFLIAVPRKEVKAEDAG